MDAHVQRKWHATHVDRDAVEEIVRGKDEACLSGSPNKESVGVIFNRKYQREKEVDRFASIDAITAPGQWLIECMIERGNWRRSAKRAHAHSYER